MDDLPVIYYGTHNLFTPYFHCMGAFLVILGIVFVIKLFRLLSRKRIQHQKNKNS